MQRLFKAILIIGCGCALLVASSLTFAAPQLVTPQLPPGIQDQPYAASLLIGSSLPLTSAGITGLPGGLMAIHNGSGSIAISGTSTASGSFTLNVTATDNAAGALSTNVSLTVIQVASNVTAVSAGKFHSCAVVNGGVQCWGEGDYGKLGNNSGNQSATPVQAIAAGSNVTAVAAGYGHSCAVVGGGVQCWGDNSAGEIGNNSTIQSLVPVQAIAAGSNVQCRKRMRRF